MYYIKETDVVIIGAGAAGAMAAIYAHRANPKIRLTVLDKSKMETSGAAGRGMVPQYHGIATLQLSRKCN